MEWLNAISLGRQHRAQDQAAQDQRRLGELTGQVFTATPEGRGSVLSEIARIDPGSAMQMRSGFMREDQNAEEATRGRLVNMAKMLAAAPEPMRGGLYTQMLPGLRQMGLQAPDVWTPDLMGVVQSLAGVSGEQHRPMVVAPGSALVGPDGQVVFQNAFKPEAPDNGTLVDVPVEGGTQKAVWRGGQLFTLDGQPFMRGGAPSQPAQPNNLQITPTGEAPMPDDPAVMAQIVEGMRSGRPFNVSVPPSGAPTMAQPPSAPSRPGFTPAPAQPRMASQQELAQLGYAPTDLVEIQPTGVPRPIRVGTQDPQEKARQEAIAKDLPKLAQARAAIKRYIDLVKQYGTEQWPGATKSQLQAAYGSARDAIRVVGNTGTLNIGELPFLEERLSPAANDLAWLGGNKSAGSIIAQGNENIRAIDEGEALIRGITYEQLMAERNGEGIPAAPPASPPPAADDDVSDLMKIYGTQRR